MIFWNRSVKQRVFDVGMVFTTGLLSLAALPAYGQNDAGSRDVAQKYMQKYDKNSDGMLREDEAKKFRFGNLMEADADGNKIVSMDELEAWSSAKRANVRQRNEQGQDEGEGGNRRRDNRDPPSQADAQTQPSGESPANAKPAEGEQPSSGAPSTEGGTKEPTGEGQAQSPPGPQGPPQKNAETPAPAAPEKASPAAVSPSKLSSTLSGKSFEGRKSFRFKTAHERLPTGIPAWFLEKDANTDGQVMMSEWTSSWSEEKARAFAEKDINGDGVITPKEALKRN